MSLTDKWIGAKLQKLIQPLESKQLNLTLQNLQYNQLVNLQSADNFSLVEV